MTNQTTTKPAMGSTPPPTGPGAKAQTPASSAKLISLSRWALYAMLLIALLVAAKYFHIEVWLQDALSWIAQRGVWGLFIFVCIYIVATVLFIPASLLTLGAGAVFGVALGSVCVSISATLGATAAFLIGRYLARDAVARKVEQSASFAAIDRAVAEEGWKIVLLTRLSPIFPFTFLNYAFGLTRVRLRHYVWASWIGMMPGTLTYVYLGSLVHLGTGHRKRSVGEWVLYGVGLAATVAVTVLVTRLARRALGKKIRTEPVANLERP